MDTQGGVYKGLQGRGKVISVGMSKPTEPTNLGILVFNFPDSQVILDFEKFLLKHLKIGSTLGNYLVQYIILPSTRLNSNLNREVYCYHCSKKHYGIPSGRLVRRFYLTDTKVSQLLYHQFTVRNWDLKTAYWTINIEEDV